MLVPLAALCIFLGVYPSPVIKALEGPGGDRRGGEHSWTGADDAMPLMPPANVAAAGHQERRPARRRATNERDTDAARTRRPRDDGSSGLSVARDRALHRGVRRDGAGHLSVAATRQMTAWVRGLGRRGGGRGRLRPRRRAATRCRTSRRSGSAAEPALYAKVIDRDRRSCCSCS
jgi:hypothetical protein